MNLSEAKQILNRNGYYLFEAKIPSKIKLKDTIDTHKATFRDEFGTYEDDETYRHSKGEGYITDKEGNVYNLKVTNMQTDQGRISGAGREFDVVIYYKDDVIHLHSYSGIFGGLNGGGKILSDLEDGYYLEDYLARNKTNIYSSKIENIIKELIAKGDANAKSFKELNTEKSKAKADKLLQDYEIKSDAYRVNVKIENGQFVNVDNINSKYLDKINKKYLNYLNGLSIEFHLFPWKSYKSNIDYKFARNKNTNDWVIIGKKTNKNGVTTTKLYNIDDIEGFNEYIDVFYFDKTELKKYIKHVSYTTYTDDYYKRNYIKFKDFIELLNKLPDTLDELKKSNRQQATYNPNRYDAENKMKAWHDGTRKQNLKLASNDKLKYYYKICNELGYDKEMEQIEAELNSRNTVV